VNLNTFVPKETAPATPNQSLDKLFLNDIVAMDADKRGKEFLVVSRGGNYVIRAHVGTDGKLTTLDAANKAIRMQTGNLPSGLVMSRDGKRAYVNNELSTSMSALNLTDNTVIARDVESSAPPAPGTQAHRNLVGKLAFFTALGLPDKLDTDGDGKFDIALRDINPLASRGKASDNAWSGCASCHDDGHSDNVTWISRPARARPSRSRAPSRATTSTTSASSTGARCVARTPTSTTMPRASRVVAVSRPTRPRRRAKTARR
jgi:hypothetical protein